MTTTDQAGLELAAAFDDFEAAGRETRAMIEATPRFIEHPEHRAQAYATLAAARAMAYAMVIAPRAELPRLHGQTSWHTTTFAIGPNCQDMRYAVVLLDGSRTYRLRGRLGEQLLSLWQVHSHVMGHPDSKEIGNYDLTNHVGPDGTVDIVVSGQEHPQPWIRLDPDSSLNFVLIRRVMGHITDDHGDLRIVEQNDLVPPPLELDPGHVAERVNRAAGLLRYLVREWSVGFYDMFIRAAGGKNKFCYMGGQSIADDLLGNSSAAYGFLAFDLEPDEALIVEWDTTVGSTYWSWQLGDVWSNALDFVNYQTDLNMNNAVLDADGVVRAVICATDPGVPNWLDTRGRGGGVLALRNYKEQRPSAAPTARKVPLADLRDHLPPDTPRVRPTQRRQVLDERRTAYLTAYGE